MWEDFGAWADHVLLTRNADTGEKFAPVTRDQATGLKTFIREIANFLYVQPARRAGAKPATKKATADFGLDLESVEDRVAIPWALQTPSGYR